MFERLRKIAQVKFKKQIIKGNEALCFQTEIPKSFSVALKEISLFVLAQQFVVQMIWRAIISPRLF